MNELISKEQKDKITSLELVEQINIFREQEGNRKELQHKDLLMRRQCSMNELISKEQKDKITSLELVEQINIFREQEGNRKELQHKDLLKVIRDEFEEEINGGKISPVEYKDKKGELRPMFELTLNQAKQVLMRESKYVRKAMIHYIEELEKQLSTIISYKDRLKLNLFSNDPEIVVRSHKALLELETRELKQEIEQKTKEIEYKEDVIIGLTDKIDLI